MHRGSDCTIIFFTRAVLSAFAALLLLGACSRSVAKDKAVLRVWDFKYSDTGMGDAMRIYDRAFEDSHPAVRVEHRGLSDVDDDAVLAAAIAANAAPDVVMVHSGMEFHAFKDKFADLSAAAAAYLPRVLPAALDACRDEAGRLRAIPITIQGFGWYYNKRLFAQAGLNSDTPPRSWADFLATCGRLQAAGIKAIAWGNNPPHGSDWLRRGFAVTFYDTPELPTFLGTAAAVRDERFVLIASLIRELRDQGYLDSDGAFRDHIFDAAERFRTGQAAMYLGLLSDISNWKEFSDALGPGNIGFFASIDHPAALYPGRLCLQDTGIVYAVFNTSPLLEAAKDYVLGYLTDDVAARLVRQTGALVPLSGWRYPVEEYPVLASILTALKTSGKDPELYYPDLSGKAALFRLDELFFNTKEINLETYLQSLEQVF